MEITTLIEIITVLITLILGFIAKKAKFIKTNLIPIQNLFIGCISFIIYYFVTKDIHVALMFSGLLAGGTYDFVKNLIQIGKNEDLLDDAVQFNELTEGGNETDGNN